MLKLDKKNCLILNLLQENCRMSLTDIAEKVNLSIDAVKKRIKKMEHIIFYPKIQIRPRSFGFSNIVDVKIKLNNHSKDRIERFIEFLTENPRVAEVFSVSGEWDLSVVIMSKDANDLGNVISDINGRFGNIINSWVESTTLKAYKFERYDMLKLMNHKKEKGDNHV